MVLVQQTMSNPTETHRIQFEAQASTIPTTLSTPRPTPTTPAASIPQLTSKPPATRRPVPAPSVDKNGNIHVFDPEGKKNCALLAMGHLVTEYVNTSYCYTLEERQDMLRNMVYTLVDLFESHDIEYWIDSGTLLGSYRDKGLIWFDLDADIGLAHESFDKLRKTKITVPPRYNLTVNDSPYYDKGPYPYLPGRFIDMKTGFYIDIFEFFPSTGPVKTVQKVKYNATTVNATLFEKGNVTVRIESDKEGSVWVEITTIIRQEAELLGPVQSGCWWACVKCPEHWHFVVPRDWIFPLKRCQFDAKQVWCPSNTVEYLTMLYGDTFMTPQ
ncbi:hypothetical protein THRCLA_07544 [Thraustotheca clavata]|uniref:LicD/FKTN/FKRP nucleotidyltransferase domain-containing protein n=1 Tax=Thraustotheca clavata TaxID=74557 RepID=A0A1V9ZD95_9STRA|nr:hypothetical protein THRCLA_07544 [Thraustotheca clavata]